jgi:hypothetical protein
LETSLPGSYPGTNQRNSDSNPIQLVNNKVWQDLANARGSIDGSNGFPQTQQQIADALGNYNKDTGGAIDSNKPYLHEAGHNQLAYCDGNSCYTGELTTNSDGKQSYNFGDLGTMDAETFKQAKEISGSQQNSPEQSPQETPETSKAQVESSSVPPTGSQNKEIVKSDNLALEDQKGFTNINILSQGDSSNRDSNEVKNALLDGQLDSASNAFMAFEKDGKNYLGYASGGFDGKLDGEDDRYGVIELDKDGKIPSDVNLGAGEGWKHATDEMKEILKLGHEKRSTEIEKAGGIENYNKNQTAKRTIDNLQNYAVKNTDLDSSKLNELMSQLNQGKNYTEEMQSQLETFTNTKIGDQTISDLASKSRINELKSLSLSDEKISKLSEEVSKAESYSAKQEIIDKAIDEQRDAKHKLTDQEKAEFNKTLKDLESRIPADSKQKEILNKLTKLSSGDGLDNKGKYLLAELKHLSSQVKEPAPSERSNEEPSPDQNAPEEGLRSRGFGTRGSEGATRGTSETTPRNEESAKQQKLIDSLTRAGYPNLAKMIEEGRLQKNSLHLITSPRTCESVK